MHADSLLSKFHEMATAFYLCVPWGYPFVRTLVLFIRVGAVGSDTIGSAWDD